MKPKLHHFAYNIRANKLEIILEFFKNLGCTLDYREKGERWCIIKQDPIPIYIQIIETNNFYISHKNKINTHIAFLSDEPEKDIKKIKQWAKNNNIRFVQGGWSDKELWFDLPDIFINFVIEIMHTSIVE